MFALRRCNTTLSASARSFSSSSRSQLAKVTLVGRITRTPELKTTQKGEEYIQYSVACKEGTKSDIASFYNVARFGPTEPIKRLLLNMPKGTIVHVDADASHVKREGETIPRLMLRQRDMEIVSKPRAKPGQQQAQQEEQEAQQEEQEAPQEESEAPEEYR